MTLLNRYLLKEHLKVFALFNLSFYFLFVLIDYATHMKGFTQNAMPLKDTLIYYFFHFSFLAEMLFAIGFVIATVKVLTSLNIRYELLAMQSSAISKKAILRPFAFCAITIALLLYLNFQFILPKAQERLDHFKHRYLKENKDFTTKINRLVVNDDTLILYHSYDSKSRSFFDVFWIINPDEIYRIKRLVPHPPTGHFVDHLIRDESGEMKKVKSYASFSFPKMHFDEKELFEAVHPPEWQSLSELIKAFWKKTSQSQLKSCFYHKMTIPLFSLLALFILCPFCMSYNRKLPLFLIYAFSLFGCCGFLTILHGCRILAENQVLAPSIAIFFPYLLLLCFFALQKFSQKGIYTSYSKIGF